MSALFGFTGRQNLALVERMGHALSHRGGPHEALHVGADATHAVRSALRPDSPQGRGVGVATSQLQSMAVAGAAYLAGEADPATPEALLARYRSDGPAFARAVRGAYVLSIIDGETVHLVRDGAGARTMYFGFVDDRWVYACEPKGIWSLPIFRRRLRPAAVAQYLTFSFVPGRGTMLENLWEVPAGYVVSFRPGREPEHLRHFACEATAPETRVATIDAATRDRWVGSFRERFSAAVAQRWPDESVAVSLSGGIDSSIVAAELADQHPGDVQAYSIHFGKRYPNELEFARAVATQLNLPLEEVEISPKSFLPRLREMVWHLDEPIGDPITAPNFELARQLSAQTRWNFNGEGGDPCFGGPKNIPMLLQHWYGGPREPDFRARAYLASYRRSYDDLRDLLAPDMSKAIDEERDLVGAVQPFFATDHPPLFLDKLLALNIRLKGAHLILPKVERLFGAWGMTPLSPLFDEHLISLAMALPQPLKMANGVDKVILREAFRGRIPDAVLTRPKSGMRVPVQFWFQGEMKRYARKILSPRAVRQAGVFNPTRVKQLLDYNVEGGNGRYGLRLWMLLTFEIWRRLVIDGEAV